MIAGSVTTVLTYASAIYFGWMIGYFALMFCGIWAAAVVNAFYLNNIDESNQRKAGFPKVHNKVFRSIGALLIIAPFHPLPWVMILIGYIGYLALFEGLDTKLQVLAIAFFGGLGYGLYVQRKPFPSAGLRSNK